MGMAGRFQQWVQFDVCECGKPGFENEGDARRFMLGKRARSEQAEMLQCPAGNCWHVYNPLIRPRDVYIRFLTETARPPAPPRPRMPLTRPLFTGTPTAAVKPAPPPAPRPEVKTAPTLTPAEPRTCAKVKYASEAMALFSLAKIPEGHGEVRAYDCGACGGWHLTSKEFDPSTIVDEVLVTFGHDPNAVTVSAGRYPDGKIAGITIRSSRGSVRVRAENLPQLATALAFVRPPEPTPSPASQPAAPAPVSERRVGPAPAQDEILDVRASGPATASEVAALAGVTMSRARSLLKKLCGKGLVEAGPLVTRSGQQAVTWKRVAKAA